MTSTYIYTPSIPHHSGRVANWIAALLHAFARREPHYPAELSRLSDHLLRDIGIDPLDVNPLADMASTQSDTLGGTQQQTTAHFRRPLL